MSENFSLKFALLLTEMLTNFSHVYIIIQSPCTYVESYQSPLILTELFQNNLINVSYLTACYLYQVMMTLHFLNDVAYDAESTQNQKLRHNS